MNPQTKPSVSFRTVGCRLNQAETATISASFESEGYEIVPHGEVCDVCVINSCTITKTAERKSVQYARAAKKINADTIVILAGCAVEADKDDSLNSPGIDILADQSDKFNLPAILKQHMHIIPVAEIPPKNAHTHLPLFTTTRALVKIQDGCDFFCAYCIVPYARGNPQSRSIEEITEEVRKLSENGFIEIVLTGANAGCYEHDGKTLVDLLKALEAIDSLKRIRLSSTESTKVLREVIDFMADSKKLCRFLHIPLQTGDNGLLKAMGRKYTSEEFLNIMNYAVEKIPLLGLGTDIITGLPGEDENAFENTVSMVRKIPFNNLHVFPYSPRSGTRAASMHNQVPVETRKARAHILTEIAKEKRTAFAKEFLGREVTVLTERIIDDSTATGWTEEYLEARIKSADITSNKLIKFAPVSVKNNILS